MTRSLVAWKNLQEAEQAYCDAPRWATGSDGPTGLLRRAVMEQIPERHAELLGRAEPLQRPERRAELQKLVEQVTQAERERKRCGKFLERSLEEANNLPESIAQAWEVDIAICESDSDLVKEYEISLHSALEREYGRRRRGSGEGWPIAAILASVVGFLGAILMRRRS